MQRLLRMKMLQFRFLMNSDILINFHHTKQEGKNLLLFLFFLIII